MTAWMIKAGTSIFGHTSFGVRWFAILCNALSGILLWKLAVSMFNRQAASLAVIFYLFAPIYCLGGLLMVPDAPMGAAWMAVCLLAWRIFGEGNDRWETWLLAGICLGLGLLSKYTAILLALSVVLLMLSRKEWRNRFVGWKFWSATAVASILCIPILIWNARYDWPTVKFHLYDRQIGGGSNFFRWGQFWASQALLLSPALFIVCLGVWVRSLLCWRDPRWRFLLIMSFPTFAIFCVQALIAEFKPHWPAPAYTLLLIGAAAWMREGFGIVNGKARRFTQVTVSVLILVFFVPLNVLFHVGALWPVLPAVARAASIPWDPKYDPTNDLYGWKDVIDEARRIRSDFSARGEAEPFLASSRYQLVSQLAFASQEKVSRLGPGRDQYEFWQTPEHWHSLVGQSALFITDNRFEHDPRSDRLFSACELRPPFIVKRGDEVARRFNIWICRGFVGFRN